MNENIVKIEATGFQDLCNHFRELEEKNKFLENENTQLKADNSVLGNELTYFKEHAVELEEQVNDLTSENVNLKARNLALSKRVNWLSSEEAGKQLARELLGVGQ